MIGTEDKRIQETLIAILPDKRKEIHKAVKTIINVYQENNGDYDDDACSYSKVFEEIQFGKFKRKEIKTVTKRLNNVKKRYNSKLNGITFEFVNMLGKVTPELMSGGMHEWEAYEIALRFPEKKDLVRPYIGISYLADWASKFGQEELIKTRKYFADTAYKTQRWLRTFVYWYGKEDIKKHERYFSRKLGMRIKYDN